MRIRDRIKRVAVLCLVVVLFMLMLPVTQVDAAPSQAEVDDKIRWIIAGIPDDCDTDYEKALYLHDYLCKTVTYELGSADEAYTALINGVADCGGYADAYRRLLLAVGISAITIRGSAGGASHAWNMVMLDGECYFTDVTWDDDPNAERFGFINHKYFNLTFEEIRTDHIAFSTGTNGFSLPDSCNHTKYGYKYTDTGELGSGHFNDSTTPEEAAKHFKVIEVDGADVYWRCDFQFDGDAGEWIAANKFQIGKILGGHADIYGGFDGYGVLRYYCNNVAFTPTESISFAEPTVYLNNSHMRQQLSVSFTPTNASYQDVTYTSSDSRIAKVDENGVVRAVSSGTATITATAVDGKTATCQVVVDHSHNAIRAVSAVTANCITKGNEAHYICDSCGTRFSDSKGKNTVSLMDVVICPTSYCSYLHYDTYRNEEGHWKVCRLCGKWGTKRIIPHEDWTGDGICDSFSSDIQPCRYVMDPSATKPPQSTQATTKPAAKPTQPASKPTEQGSSPTQPTTETTAPATGETLLPETSTPPTQTEQTPSTDGTKEQTGTAQSTPATSNPAQPNQTPDFQWIALVLIGVAVVAIVIILIMRRRKH